jgi:hypothetical protein
MMELPAGINRRYASTAIFILALLWIWVAFDRPYNIPSHISWDVLSNRPSVAQLSDVFDYPPLRSAAFQQACDWANPDATVTFVCDESPGDVAEVRNSILTCVRYAMKAGANLVVPRIKMREDYARDREMNSTSMDYMFDVEYFTHSMEHFCPNMRLYSSVDQVLKDKRTVGPVSLVLGSLVQADAIGQTSQEKWKAAFDEWLGKQIKPGNGMNLLIEVDRSFLKYPVASDDIEFVNIFGKIMKFGYDVGYLATVTLAKLSHAFEIPFDITSPIIPDMFFGAHLSTGRDLAGVSSKIEKANYEYGTQSKLYLDHASNSNFSAIYASSDVLADLQSFYVDAEARNMTVVTKFDLLTGKDREALLELTPDQQAMVDILVHSKATEFVGVGHSNIAWSIALSRHKFSQQPNYSNEPEEFSDELSQVYGVPKSHPLFSAGMWP